MLQLAHIVADLSQKKRRPHTCRRDFFTVSLDEGHARTGGKFLTNLTYYKNNRNGCATSLHWIYEFHRDQYADDFFELLLQTHLEAGSPDWVTDV